MLGRASGQTSLGLNSDRIIPRVVTTGGRESFRVTFPNGRGVEVEAPASAELAALGAAAMTAVEWPPLSADDDSFSQRSMRLQYGTVEDLYTGAVPLRTYPGTDGQAQVFLRGDRRLPSVSQTGNEEVMVIPLGSWVAELDVRDSADNQYDLSDEEEAEFARLVSATTEPDGFLRLSLIDPLRLTDDRLMWIVFGDPSSAPSLQLTPFYCGQPESQGDEPTLHEEGPWTSATWCDAETGLFVNARGARAFVDDIADSLTLRPVGA